MSWFEYSQNNSGGSFDVDQFVTHRVFVEADSLEEAIRIGIGLGIYFDGCENGMDCSCCGDRWYEPGEVELPLGWSIGISFKTIEEYAQHLASEFGYFGSEKPDTYLYYKDGRKVEFYEEQK